ncbi:MAG: spore maturation protein [Clostridium sp. SCN 57-10]|nr:MAG: spore maturation protein [Clostridium sp. SCN 57-10]
MGTWSVWVMPALVALIPLYGVLKGVKVYAAFIEGAKEGFETAVRVIPYLVAMLVAVGVFRASGAMSLLTTLLRPVTTLLGIPAELVPLGVMRSLSGGGAQGLLAELLRTFGPDSFLGRAASVVMGSTETTLYTVAVYYGSIGVRDARCTVAVGLAADAFSMLAAVLFTRLLL